MSLLLSILVQDAIMAGAAIWLLHRNGLSLKRVGLGSITARQALVGLGLGALLFLGGLLVERGVSHLLPPSTPPDRLGGYSARQPIAEAFLQQSSYWVKGALAAAGVVVASFCEELLFRGCLQTMLRPRVGVAAAAVGSALLFALAHVSPLSAVVTAFLIGLAFSGAYERTGSLWMPILMHSVNNALSFSLLWMQGR